MSKIKDKEKTKQYKKAVGINDDNEDTATCKNARTKEMLLFQFSG